MTESVHPLPIPSKIPGYRIASMIGSEVGVPRGNGSDGVKYADDISGNTNGPLTVRPFPTPARI